MKFLIVASLLFVVTMAQRSPYAGSSPKGRPELASRFRDPNESTTVKVFNRIGEDGSTMKIPVDARGDGELVDRLNQWPREHQPFWLLNAEHIEASRNGNQQQNANNNNLATRFGEGGNQETLPIRPTEQRSSFLGPLN